MVRTLDLWPRSRSNFSEKINEFLDSIVNYFAQLSNNVYTIYGSNVFGWYTLPYSQKDILMLSNNDAFAPLGTDASFNYFDKIKEFCVQFALENGAMLHRQRIIVVNAGNSAVYGKKNGVLLSPSLMFSSVLTHEMVHSFSIGHSYSDRKIRVFPYATNGEYDDRYDLMSTANAYMLEQRTFGFSRLASYGSNSIFWARWTPKLYIEIIITECTAQEYAWLAMFLPFDRMDGNNYYTVELRTPDNYDRGISQNAVLIHRVQRSGENYYSVLLSQSRDYYELTEGTEWVTFLEPSNTGRFQMIRVTVRRMYTHDVDINIQSTFDPISCRMGEVPKMVIEAQLGLAYVCLEKNRPVLPSDIQVQEQRKDFYKLKTTFGANTCKPGYVWRGLDAYDYVCVKMHRRQLAHAQTIRLNENVIKCQNDTVPREAFIGDQFCVTRIEKYLILRDNMDSVQHLKYFEFFNGVDTVSA